MKSNGICILWFQWSVVLECPRAGELQKSRRAALAEAIRFLSTEHWWRIAAKQSLDSDLVLCHLWAPQEYSSILPVLRGLYLPCHGYSKMFASSSSKLFVQRIDRLLVTLVDLVLKECV